MIFSVDFEFLDDNWEPFAVEEVVEELVEAPPQSPQSLAPAPIEKEEKLQPYRALRTNKPGIWLQPAVVIGRGPAVSSKRPRLKPRYKKVFEAEGKKAVEWEEDAPYATPASPFHVRAGE